MSIPYRHLKKASNPFQQSSHDDQPVGPEVPPKTSHTPGPGPNEPCPENKTMFQAFEWNCPKDQKHWKRLTLALPFLKSIGIDSMWIPPGCKGGWHGSNGYDIYDLYDLGEFQQKDSKATKWGTKDDLVEMTEMAAKCGVGVYWDAVLNHKAAADFSEPCYAVKVDPQGTFDVDSLSAFVDSKSSLCSFFNDPFHFLSACLKLFCRSYKGTRQAMRD
jgi:Alpha amylase, catalytic domain